MSNLVDGFDLYNLDSFSHVYNIPTTGPNCPLPALFIHEGQSLLFGSASGRVRIRETWTQSVQDVLQHPGTPTLVRFCMILISVIAGEIIQAIVSRIPRRIGIISSWSARQAYTKYRGVKYITTGTATDERDASNSVRVWRSTEKMMPTLTHPRKRLMSRISVPSRNAVQNLIASIPFRSLIRWAGIAIMFVSLLLSERFWSVVLDVLQVSCHPIIRI